MKNKHCIVEVSFYFYIAFNFLLKVMCWGYIIQMAQLKIIFSLRDKLCAVIKIQIN